MIQEHNPPNIRIKERDGIVSFFLDGVEVELRPGEELFLYDETGEAVASYRLTERGIAIGTPEVDEAEAPVEKLAEEPVPPGQPPSTAPLPAPPESSVAERLKARRKKVKKKSAVSSVVGGALVGVAVVAIATFLIKSSHRLPFPQSREPLLGSEIQSGNEKEFEELLTKAGWSFRGKRWILQPTNGLCRNVEAGDTVLQRELRVGNAKRLKVQAKVALSGAKFILFAIEGQEEIPLGIALLTGEGSGVSTQHWKRAQRGLHTPFPILQEQWYSLGIELDRTGSEVTLFFNGKEIANFDGLPRPPYKFAFLVKNGTGYIKDFQVKQQ